MQRIFSADGPWPTPWMERVLPVVTALASRHPRRTVFTRFIPPARAEQMPGMWQRYYSRWHTATRECLDPRLLELMPPLAALCPPATIINKTRYSGFAEPYLLGHLRQRRADALIIPDPKPTSVCWRRCSPLWTSAVALSLPATPCAVPRTRVMTCSCASITRATQSRSRRPIRKRS
jgi:Isochorismatase family